MREYPNVLKRSLEKDEAFNQEVQAAVMQLFANQSSSALTTEQIDAKVIAGYDNVRYLLAHDLHSKKMTVYQEWVHEWNKDDPFHYTLESLKEDGKAYASGLVLSFPTGGAKQGGTLLEKIKELSESLGASYERLAAFLEDRDEVYSVTSCPYELRQFCSFLGVARNDAFWVQHSQALNALLQPKAGEIQLCISYMKKVAEQQNFVEGNEFEFNDLDNHMWQQDGGVVLTSQNLGFYAQQQDDTLTIYAWDKEQNNCKARTELADLLADIHAGKTDLIGHVALKIENGQVTFVDNALIYCLDLDILFTKNALVAEGYGAPAYPVDIYSYAYQLAYHQKHYNMSEFRFLNQALLTLGGGFDYDAEKGRFYSDDVTYDPAIVGYTRAETPQKAQSIYGYPEEFTKLDADWAAAVQRLVDILKTDRPEPVLGESKEEKKQILDNIITQYEQALAALAAEGPSP